MGAVVEGELLEGDVGDRELGGEPRERHGQGESGKTFLHHVILSSK
jgi:hypothetical protein